MERRQCSGFAVAEKPRFIGCPYSVPGNEGGRPTRVRGTGGAVRFRRQLKSCSFVLHLTAVVVPRYSRSPSACEWDVPFRAMTTQESVVRTNCRSTHGRVVSMINSRKFPGLRWMSPLRVPLSDKVSRFERSNRSGPGTHCDCLENERASSVILVLTSIAEG